MSYSLQKRLHRNLLLALTVTMVVLLALLYSAIHRLTQDYVSSRLTHDLEGLISALKLEPDGLWSVESDKISSLYSRVHSGHYFIVNGRSNIIRSRSLFDTEIRLNHKADSQIRCQRVRPFAKEVWRECSQKIKKSQNELTIWVAEDITAIETRLNRFFSYAALAVGLSILALLFWQYLMVKKGFAVFSQIKLDIGSSLHGAKTLDKELYPTETYPLLDEIERLLNQLEQRVKISRNALGNMAHQLKQPLQRYRIQIEHMSSQQREEHEYLYQQIQQILERELKRARIVGLVSPGRYSHLFVDLEQLKKIMVEMYPDISIDLHCDAELILPFDRDDMLELLGNLLDNACKFAKSRVDLSIAKESERCVFTLWDDGRGVSPEQLKMLTQRGVRLDESVAGHGLGLSICVDIVESYHGSLGFTDAATGGLQIEIVLPLH